MKPIIRPARSEDLDEILRVEESAWDEGMRATREQWASRIEVFSEGTLVATIEGKIQGVVSTEIIPGYDFEHDAFTWYEVTDHCCPK